jgi:hypothetical protein
MVLVHIVRLPGSPWGSSGTMIQNGRDVVVEVESDVGEGYFQTVPLQ